MSNPYIEMDVPTFVSPDGQWRLKVTRNVRAPLWGAATVTLQRRSRIGSTDFIGWITRGETNHADYELAIMHACAEAQTLGKQRNE